jgi:hypothetical protein
MGPTEKEHADYALVSILVTREPIGQAPIELRGLQSLFQLDIFLVSSPLKFFALEVESV